MDLETKGRKALNSQELTESAREICERLNAVPPGELLLYIAAGVDPRTTRINARPATLELYHFLHDLKESWEMGLPPSREDLDRVFKLLEFTPAFDIVSRAESVEAAKQLLPIFYAKQKHIEHTIRGSVAVADVEKMYSKKEILAFKRKLEKVI